MDFIFRAFIALAIVLIMFLLSKDRGQHEPKTMLWAAAGFGIAGLVMAAFVESQVVSNVADAPLPSLQIAFQESMKIGLIEETVKFLPLALFIFPKRYFNEHTDGVLYFAIAGLAFGLPENLLYTAGSGIATGLVRLLMTPYFHAATTAFIGYFLIRYKLKQRPFAVVPIAFLAMVLAHGMYDFGLLSGDGWFVLLSISITLGVTASLFVFIKRALKLDQAMGLAAVGNNNFCRACGTPNPHKNLFCTRCGQRT